MAMIVPVMIMVMRTRMGAMGVIVRHGRNIGRPGAG